VDVDPLASMRCWAVEIELGGRVYEIPALPAVEWWPVLASGDLGQILDFIESTPDDPRNVDDLLLSGALTAEELTQALTDAIEETAGRSFHAAIVLATVASGQWAAIGGALAQTGFRWDEQPLGAALDAIYAIITERLNREALDQFLALLENEALTKGKPSARQRAKVRDEFESMAGPRPTTGVVATGERSDSERPRTRPRPRPPLRAARSASPRPPRAGRAGSGPLASSASPPGAAGPTSGTGPLPPPSAR
jgi:hypothetical protein